jgi:putative transposase
LRFQALLHHSDQGSQYTSEQFQRLMTDKPVLSSPKGASPARMSRSGNVWDNAAMESIFSLMKTERIGQKTYRTRNHAKADVFDYQTLLQPASPALDAGLSQPHGLRATSAGSLT